MHRQRLIHHIPTKRMGRRHRLKTRQRNRLQHPTRHHPNPGSTKNHGKRRQKRRLQTKRILHKRRPQRSPTNPALRMIRALYAIGADIIRIHFKNTQDTQKYKNEIKNFVRDNFLGAEIIDETPDEITLQILIKHSEFAIEKASPTHGNRSLGSKPRRHSSP